MAVWETPTPITNGAVWSRGFLDTIGNGQMVKLDDGNGSGDTILKAGEVVSVSLVDGRTLQNYVFKGRITFDGEVYPVVASPSGTFWYAVGLPRNSANIPQTLSEADLDKSDFTVCFFPGTLIATPSGERKVEELACGDLVLIGDSGAIPTTWFGRKFARSVSVKWIGRQTVSTRFGPAERLMPVRFAAGSLGGGGGGANHSTA